jgi:pimeloyl-ACP methyl ester carboxylesterase
MTRYVLLPGAGSAGTVWAGVAEELGAEARPLPDRPDVVAMAAEVLDSLGSAPDPIVLVGASLGAMVALEIARARPVAGMVLMAAGPGIYVDPRVLARVKDPNVDLARIARSGLADGREGLVATRLADLRAVPPGLLGRHLGALAAHRPAPLADPPPTVVLWGQEDRSVPLDDHIALAVACRGAIRPLPGVGHAAYLEAPGEVVRWARYLAALAGVGTGT